MQNIIGFNVVFLDVERLLTSYETGNVLDFLVKMIDFKFLM